MQGMMIAGVYAGGDLRLSAPDPADTTTMRWDPSQIDKTLTPAAHFTHLALKTPQEAGQAQVYAAEVVHEAGRWTVTDGRFDAAQAMFLANMSVLPHGELTDGFLPLYRVQRGK
jgi:hypothetical protein